MKFGDRRVRRVKLAAMLVAGLVAGFATAAASPALGVAVGWLAASMTYNIMVWAVIPRLDADATRAFAAAEDPGRGVTELLIITANLLSLAAVGVVVLDSHAGDGKTPVLAAGAVALVCAMSSWLLVHTVFTLRYADMYYDGTEGGIDFNQTAPPTFLDFAYMSFSLGMTYQVSDTSFTNSDIRRVGLIHSLVSYIFGMFVLAGTFNIVLGLAS